MDVSVIIVNYNTLQMTKDCIDSVMENTTDVEYEIILVDNASTDGSREFFKNYRGITYIYNEKNLGFGAANNVGMRIARGENILCLNSDTIFINNALKYFVEYETEYNHNVVLGSWLLDQEKNITHSYGYFITPLKEIRTAIRVYTDRIPLLNRISFDEEKYSDLPLIVDYITGADLFVPMKIINKVGMFDERFFMYCEETDWQKRMEKEGVERVVINGPKIMHLEQGSQKTGTTSFKKNPNKLIISTRSTLLYLRKYNNVVVYAIFKYTYLFLRFFPMLFNEYLWKDKVRYFKVFFE